MILNEAIGERDKFEIEEKIKYEEEIATLKQQVKEMNQELALFKNLEKVKEDLMSSLRCFVAS